MVELVDVKVRLDSLTISDGSIVKMGGGDALIVVGPNNSGKSQLLRDVEGLFRRDHNSSFVGKVVKEVGIISPMSMDVSEALAALREDETDYYSSYGVRVHKNHVHNALHLVDQPPKFGETAAFFVKRISSDDRLSVVAPSSAMDAEGPKTPGQVLYDNQSLLTSVSTIFKRAFVKDLFLDYRSGGSIPIYVGEKPALPHGADRVSDEYVKLVRACDKLHEQGDGMKSFGGILLSTLVVNYNITLIDEPEAFLHPPQERIIGKILADEATGQVICSTHSTNVLQGFLESQRESVRVMRITRGGDLNQVSEISPDEIKELWRDPVFRYSTALDALFHDQAILCEADADCRFFEAVSSQSATQVAVDSHYIPCGGKAAFPKFIRALRKLSIPVRAILDLDVLNDEETIKKIYEAQDGTWSDVSQLWRRLDQAIRDGVAVESVEASKTRLRELLDDWHEGSPPTSDIVEVLKQKKPWGKVKAGGLAAVPPGDARRYADELLEALAAKHIYPIPVGTLENFVRSVGNHGIKWLNEVLSTYTLSSAKLREAREFVSTVLR